MPTEDRQHEENCFLTEPARQAAVRRIRTYREFCAQAQHELDAEDVI